MVPTSQGSTDRGQRIPGFRSTHAEPPAANAVNGYAISVIAGGVVIALLYWARAVFITTLVAVIIAFLLEPFVGLLVRIRIPRSLATFLVCLIAVLALYFAGLSLWRQLSGMAREAPELQNNLAAAVESTTGSFQKAMDSAGRILGGGREARSRRRSPSGDSGRGDEEGKEVDGIGA
jgi:predicted PurR-regulated permease PerM